MSDRNEDARSLLPPMATLHAFEAAASTGGFSSAASRLAITQGAVSRQVAQLEQWLGQELFDRNGRRVALNAAGRAYAEAIGPALTSIRRATRSAIAGDARNIVELATLPSFGMRWLAPRLPSLNARHPDLVVNLTARSDEFSFTYEPFDLAIHFGRPEWPGADLHLLFHEVSVAVISPTHAVSVQEPGDLLKLPLLALRTRTNAWNDWFARLGIGSAPALAGTFSQFVMMAQAVAAGSGAALVPRFLIEPELSAGALVTPFDLSVESDEAYYLVRPRDRASQAADGFSDWILDEAETYRSGRPAQFQRTI